MKHPHSVRFLCLLTALCLLAALPAAGEAPAAPMAADPLMQAAIDEALAGIAAGDGGPFGAVVVRDGAIVGRGHNRVLADHDPTAHGEIMAIRDACARLGTHDLAGCALFTTAEPCPMCLFACMWANVDRVVYGCTLEDTGRLGFRDAVMDGITADRAALGGWLVCQDREACLALFAIYAGTEHELY